MRTHNICLTGRANFLLFLSGRSLSVLMSSVYTFAVGLYVLKMTGSGLSFAVTLSLQILPTVLLGPFAGVLADKFDRKAIVIFTDGFGGLLFIALLLMSAKGITLFEIYAATLLLSVSQTFYNVGVDSAVPNIVPPSTIGTLNSIGKIVDSAAAIVSPALGGILYAAVGLRFFILLNGAAFILSTVTECLIDFRLYPDPGQERRKLNLRRDLAEGLGYIRATGWIRSTLLNFLIVNFFFALCWSVPVPYLLNSVLRLPPRAYGAVQGFMPVGMIAGALLVKKAGALPDAALMAFTGMVCSACLLMTGLLPAFVPHPPLALTLPYYALLAACAGIAVSLIDIPFINNFQTRVPGSIRGRSLSLSISAVKILTPVGYLLSGCVLQSSPAFLLPLCGGALLLGYYLVRCRAALRVSLNSINTQPKANKNSLDS